jgi:hypothetical protein
VIGLKTWPDAKDAHEGTLPLEVTADARSGEKSIRVGVEWHGP